MKLTIDYLEEERFFGGTVNDGIFMPYSAGFSRDLRVWHAGNQASSFLLSDRGRTIYSDKPFKYEFFSDHMEVEGEDIFVERNGDTLKSAYTSMCKKFAPAGKNTIPPEIMFSSPQYNTWIEMEWDCTQDKVLEYADRILSHGYPAGVLMIDDCWCRAYGDWNFNAASFPDPKAMIDKLHRSGFKVMLWCCPFVSPDTAVFRELEKLGALVKKSDGTTAISHWWNGYSAVLDLTNPTATAWFEKQASALMDNFGIDGFKFDAADPEYYDDDFVFSDGSERSTQAKIWAEIGAKYSFNELRAGFNAGWLPVVNRLRDKNHSWDNDGFMRLSISLPRYDRRRNGSGFSSRRICFRRRIVRALLSGGGNVPHDAVFACAVESFIRKQSENLSRCGRVAQRSCGVYHTDGKALRRFRRAYDKKSRICLSS